MKKIFSIFARDLNRYLIFDGEKLRIWVTMDLKEVQVEKLGTYRWVHVHSEAAVKCIKRGQKMELDNNIREIIESESVHLS